MTGRIFDIKEMAVHDGPGSRLTVFLKGCPLRCLWCHNPEGQSAEKQLMIKHSLCTGCGLCRKGCTHPECEGLERCVHACPNDLISLCGTDMTSDELIKKITPCLEMTKEMGGGITFSGGEPLLQADFVAQTAEKLRGYHRALETCGYAERETFKKVLAEIDFVLFDIKLASSSLHEKYTGVPNERIIENYHLLRESGVPYIIRTPLIPGITDTDENLEGIRKIIGSDSWEKLAYNEFAGAKYPMLGRKYPLDNMITGEQL